MDAARINHLRKYVGAIALLISSWLATTCAAQVQRPGSDSIPAAAPDTLWEDALLNPFDDGAIARDVISINFRPEASVEQRAEAIRAVTGRLIGGIGSDTGEGWYVIRIPDPGGGAMEALRAAVETLQSFEFVVVASPWIVIIPAAR